MCEWMREKRFRCEFVWLMNMNDLIFIWYILKKILYHFLVRTPYCRVTVKQDVTPDGIAAEAQIVNVDSSDSGPYFCQASNLYGRDQQLVQLQVLEPPQAPTSVTAALITSRSVQLKWQPRGADASEVTKYIVEFMEVDRNNWQEITTGEKHKTRSMKFLFQTVWCNF